MRRPHFAALAALSLLSLSATQTRANIIVTEAGSNDVRSYSSPNVSQFLYPTLQPGNTTNPIGVAIDGGNAVYVVNNQFTGTNANSVARFTPTLGANGFLVSPGPITPGSLAAPYGITFDTAGNAYVTNEAQVTGQTTQQGFVQQILPNGTTGPLGQFGLGSSHLPAGIAFTTAANVPNPNYNLFVAENGNATNTVNTGNSIVEYRTDIPGAASVTLTSALLLGPTGLAFSPDGKTLFIVSQGNNSVVTYNLNTGVFANFITSGLNTPMGITTDPAGNVYVSTIGGGQGNGTILEYSSAGAFITTFATGLNNPAFLAFTPVPEPSSVVMMGLGVGFTGIVAYRRKRKAEAAA